jgi:Family of unknown function (DUF5335)
MSTIEVTRNDWTSFFDTFSKQHQGWLASLEVLGDEVGAQREVIELPLEGISVNAEEDPESLIISFGKTPKDHVTHTVDRPRHVWVNQTVEGVHESLEFEEEDNQKTLLRFRSPIRPELVDGIV